VDCPQGYIQSRTREACRIFDLKLKGKSSYRLGKLWGLLYEALPPAAELSEAMLYFLCPTFGVQSEIPHEKDFSGQFGLISCHRGATGGREHCPEAVD